MDDHHKGTKDTKVEDIDQGLSRRVIGLAIEVHRLIGPGLLESAYEECLCRELELAGLSFRRQMPVPVEYKGHRLECGYRLDLVVEDRVLVELKAIDHLLPIHEAQVLTYLRLTGLRIGLLMNFHALRLKDGIRRLVL
jgi:GxxExxY protein